METADPWATGLLLYQVDLPIPLLARKGVFFNEQIKLNGGRWELNVDPLQRQQNSQPLSSLSSFLVSGIRWVSHSSGYPGTHCIVEAGFEVFIVLLPLSGC